MKRFNVGFFSLLLAVITAFQTSAKEPNGYYQSAEGKNKGDLLSALCGIVGPHRTVSYDGLWDVYVDSDTRPDGTVWDMYSTSKFRHGSRHCGNYSKVGDCYNREHSFPKSWFSKGKPMVSDAFHVYPTDGKVNGQRSNHPYGECSGGTYLPANGSVKPLGKLGHCTFPGYSGTVFEPDDEYKGDFARTYFYMAAAYNGRIQGFHSEMLAGNSYPCYTKWAVNLLMKWHRQDPVSQKELDRNEAVSRHQNNRNPFIDHPELAEYVWGNMTDKGWVPGGEVVPSLSYPNNGQSFNIGITAINSKVNQQIRVKGSNLSENMTVSSSNSKFTLSSTTLSSAYINSANGAVLTISFTSATAGDYSSTITLSSKELGNTTFTVNAKAVDGIPALAATNVTTESFTANWLNVSGVGAKYTLNVFKGTEKVKTVTVNASDEKYTVSGLQHSTVYSYNLTSGSMNSNTIEVTTATPIPVLSLIFDEGSLDFNAVPGKPSNATEVKVYTENIEEEITAEIEGSFEISFDKTNWSNTLTIASVGESFFIRSKAINSEGNFKGHISLSTAKVSGDEIDLTVIVAAPRTFFEDFEKIEAGGYWTDVIKGSACSWKFNDAGVWGDNRRNGLLSCRFGKTSTSSITMNEDKLNGAGSLSFFTARYGNDAEATLVISYSIDKGQTWTKLQELIISETLMTQHVISTNIKENVRFKFEQTSGKRINIDDIAITDFSAGVNDIFADEDNWNIYPSQNGVKIEAEEGSNVIIYSVNAITVHEETMSANSTFIPLEKGIYIVTLDNNRGKKIVVK